MSGIQLQNWYHCIEYTRPYEMNLISPFCNGCNQSWVILASYFLLHDPVLWAVQVLARINNWLKWANLVSSDVSWLKLGSFDGAWFTEYNGNNSVAISQIFMEWDNCFIHWDNIWQILIVVWMDLDCGHFMHDQAVNWVWSVCTDIGPIDGLLHLLLDLLKIVRDNRLLSYI